MNTGMALAVLEQAGLSALAGTPLELVLLQAVSGLSRLVTPDDVAAAGEAVAKAVVDAAEAVAAAVAAMPPSRPEPSALECDDPRRAEELGQTAEDFPGGVQDNGGDEGQHSGP